MLPIFRFLFRKMWNTRWLTLSTLLGLVVAVSFTTSIPMYADGSLKRVVAQSLAEKSSGFPAGSVLMRYQTVGSDRPDLESFNDVNAFIANDIRDNINFPYHNYVETFSIRSARLVPVDSEKVDPSKRRQMSLTSMSELEDYAELSNGRMFSDVVTDDIIEAVVLDEALFRNYFQVGDEFIYPARSGSGTVPLHIKVVGSFQAIAGDNVHDHYWYQGLDTHVNSFFIHEDVFTDHLLEEQNVTLDMANWYYNFDLRDIQTSDLSPLSNYLTRLEIELYQKLSNTRVDVSFLSMLSEFRSQSIQLQSLLFTLAAPMIAMVFYFIAMNSRQSLERQRADIAVLRSRGGSTRQIIWLYLLEGLLLGGIALVLGPLIGWFMAKSIGSSSGFLTFVNRQSIPVDFNLTTALYGIAAVIIALTASLIPAIQYAKSSIVGLKQQLARADRKPLWQRYYLDILLIAISGYGWYLFNQQQFLSLQTGLSSDQIQAHPLLFFVPALTIFSIGLFFLRLFPWILRAFTWLGRTYLPVFLYLTLTQLSRSAKSYYPLMLLLVLTLGLGVYNASAARTIDLNSTEKVMYEYGTDVIIQSVWEGFSEGPIGAQNPGGGGQNPGGGEQNPGGGEQNPGGGGQNPGGGGGGSSAPVPSRTVYIEPPFEVFKDLEGVEQATRVLKTLGNVIVSGRSTGQGMVMGIENIEFAEVAWFDRLDLFPAGHPNDYLNLLGTYEQAVLIPTAFAERNHLEVNDIITINIEQQPIEFVVAGTLPYWPSQYPQQVPFFITNIDYIYDQTPMIPYEVWIKMEEGARAAPLVEELAEKGIYLASIEDVRNELAQLERHPSRGGVFGILSLGFLVTVMVTLVGYILYWFFNLSSRVVQFGILRAMGLSRRQLTGMLLLEQGFTAGLSIGLGILIGKLASYLYLPFLQTSGNAQLQVPPFRVIFEARDTNQLYFVVLIMMITGATLLLLHIRRLRVHQAVKLGEER